MAEPLSIRSRLRRELLMWLALVALVTGVGLYFFVRGALTSQFDAALLGKARALAASVKIEGTDEGDKVEFDVGGESMADFERAKGPEYFQLWWRADGDEVQRSRSLGDEGLPRGKSGGPEATFGDLEVGPDIDARAVWLRFQPRVEEADAPSPHNVRREPLVLAVARVRGELDRPLEVLVAGMAGAGALLALGAVIAVRRSLRAGLAPLRELASGVAAIDPAALPATVNVPRLPAEIEPVRARLNELLKRVGATLERERRFAGSAAHELRTPLAELGALLDVRLKWPQSVDACSGSLREARGITERMAGLVEMLLDLVRAEARGGTLAVEWIDLASEIDRAMTAHAQAAKAKGVTWEIRFAPGVKALANDGAVASIAHNLGANAVEYTPRGGSIVVTVWGGERGRGPAFEVTSGPCELTAEDLALVFEPFWRKNAARSAPTEGGTHAGLGLSLVDALARGMGCRVEAGLDSERRLTIRVVWPEEQAG